MVDKEVMENNKEVRSEGIDNINKGLRVCVPLGKPLVLRLYNLKRIRGLKIKEIAFESKGILWLIKRLWKIILN